MNVTAIINFGWPGYMLRALSAFNDGDNLQAFLDTQVVWSGEPVTAQQVLDAEPEYLAHVAQKQKEAEEARATEEKLSARAEVLAKLTVTISTGKVFDANDEARQNMADAIQAASFVGDKETYWKLADNSVSLVSLNEVREAHALAIQEKGKLILGGG